MHAYETVTELSNNLITWFTWYNDNRKHSSLDKRTSNESYLCNRIWHLKPKRQVIAHFTFHTVSQAPLTSGGNNANYHNRNRANHPTR
ncbi:transposase [Oryzomonas sagensis]|uniref:Transposase n=1 Tax=Oryzomonas sagensis TaxID=2603857 RepID=A0ABQ6TV67_9BACT|nr:transposase [Oryzomonas sagensis]